jgi:hypothetical protein
VITVQTPSELQQMARISRLYPMPKIVGQPKSDVSSVSLVNIQADRLKALDI